MSIPRIHGGGGLSFFGSLNRLSPYEVFFVKDLMMYMKIIVTEKPKRGETNNDKPISCAFPQLTASPVASGKSEYARPTPNIDPINVCELEQGIPRYQVKRFQKIAVSSSAMTMAKLCAIF